MLHPWVLSDTAQAGRLSKEAERKKHAKKGKEKGKKERKKKKGNEPSTGGISS